MKAILTGHQPRQVVNNPTPPNAAPSYIPNKNNKDTWHTGTPAKDGMYICKVFYGDIPNDIRILEWVGAMDCFCLPNSNTRIYHFFVGENGGKVSEVVYEWLKLDLRFRMEKKWIEPTPIYLNSSIRGTLEDCIKAAKTQQGD